MINEPGTGLVIGSSATDAAGSRINVCESARAAQNFDAARALWRQLGVWLIDPSLPPVAAGRRLAALLGGRRICGEGLGTREVDAGKQRRPCEQACDNLLHRDTSFVVIRNHTTDLKSGSSKLFSR